MIRTYLTDPNFTLCWRTTSILTSRANHASLSLKIPAVWFVFLQVFRLQLALEAGQMEATGPSMSDQRLHVKPHHQPILFVDDSQAPSLQLLPKHKGQLPVKGQIAASHGPSGDRSCSSASRQDLSHEYGFPNPQGKSGGSLQEAESIPSSSPRASPLSLMQRFMSHGKGHGQSHSTKHAAAKAVDLGSSSMSEAKDTDLLCVRQGSSNSSSSRPQAAGPSHGSDSRFAAMKSLTRSAISLDDTTKLATARRRGTLAPRKALAAGRSLEAGLDLAPSDYDYDLEGNLTRAGSTEDSGGSSFTDVRGLSSSTGLVHLHSAPTMLSRDPSMTAAASGGGHAAAFGDILLSEDMSCSSTAPLLAQDSEHKALVSSVADGAQSMTGQNAGSLQMGSRQNHSPYAASASKLLHSMSSSGATRSAAVDPLLLPLSQDSLDFTLLDPESLLEAQELDSQQLLDPVAASSSSPREGLQLRPGHTSAWDQQDQQLLEQPAAANPEDDDEDQELLEQPAYTSSSLPDDAQLQHSDSYSQDHQSVQPSLGASHVASAALHGQLMPLSSHQGSWLVPPPTVSLQLGQTLRDVSDYALSMSSSCGALGSQDAVAPERAVSASVADEGSSKLASPPGECQQVLPQSNVQHQVSFPSLWCKVCDSRQHLPSVHTIQPAWRYMMPYYIYIVLHCIVLHWTMYVLYFIALYCIAFCYAALCKLHFPA